MYDLLAWGKRYFEARNKEDTLISTLLFLFIAVVVVEENQANYR